MMNSSANKGFSFGLTSSAITTLGLMVGLDVGTGSRAAVVGGVLTIAIADAFSDALAIHVSVESERKSTRKDIWQATISTYLSKFFFALTFLVPVLLLELDLAIIASIAWGLSILAVLSYVNARKSERKPHRAVIEHLAIASVVLGLSYLAGRFIARYFA